MKGKMLSEDDYQMIQSMSTVRDIGLYLKNQTYYSQSLAGIDENNIHRGRLEILLYRALITDALKIASYLKGKEKLIYRFVYRRQEVEDIKKMLRVLMTGKSLDTMDKQILFISRHSRIDFNKVMIAKTIRELVDALKGSNFFDVLNPLVQDESNIDLFAAETALDMYFYQKIFNQMKNYYSGKDAEILERAFGFEADFKNILWIYRGKKYYDLRKEVLYSNLIDYRYKLKMQELTLMIEADNSEKVLAIVKETYLKKYINFDGDHWLTDFLSRQRYEQELNMRLYPFSLAPIISYIFLKEIEIQNITTIVEGVRYAVEPSKFEAYLAKRNT